MIDSPLYLPPFFSSSSFSSPRTLSTIIISLYPLHPTLYPISHPFNLTTTSTLVLIHTALYLTHSIFLFIITTSIYTSQVLTPNGDATELGLYRFFGSCIKAATGMEIEDYRTANPKVHEVPFNSSNKWQMSIHSMQYSGKELLLLKVRHLTYMHAIWSCTARILPTLTMTHISTTFNLHHPRAHLTYFLTSVPTTSQLTAQFNPVTRHSHPSIQRHMKSSVATEREFLDLQ